jgi:hypothetical protein
MGMRVPATVRFATIVFVVRQQHEEQTARGDDVIKSPQLRPSAHARVPPFDVKRTGARSLQLLVSLLALDLVF